MDEAKQKPVEIKYGELAKIPQYGHGVLSTLDGTGTIVNVGNQSDGNDAYFTANCGDWSVSHQAVPPETQPGTAGAYSYTSKPNQFGGRTLTIMNVSPKEDAVLLVLCNKGST